MLQPPGSCWSSLGPEEGQWGQGGWQSQTLPLLGTVGPTSPFWRLCLGATFWFLLVTRPLPWLLTPDPPTKGSSSTAEWHSRSCRAGGG